MNAKKLIEMRKKAKLTQDQLAEKIGVTRKTIINYEKGGVIPESKVSLLDIVLSENVNLGDNFNSEEKATLSYESGRPFYDGDWELGFNDSFDENLTNPEFNIDFPPANKTEGFWMRGKGKSMLGEIDPGDFIYFSPMEDFSWFPFGRIYGIVTKNKMRIVKRVVKSDKPGHYLLISSNPDKLSYPDQDIPIEMVEKMFEVKFVIKNLNE